MAVGARATDILRQFLVEAVVLCLLGGALGIAARARRRRCSCTMTRCTGRRSVSMPAIIARRRRLGDRRDGLRLLPGVEGLAARPDRGPAVRVMERAMGLPIRTVVPSSIAAVVVTGCVVGPDYHRPATTMPAGWVPQGPGATTLPSQTGTQTPNLTQWWAQFNDAELSSLVERACTATSICSRPRLASARRGLRAGGRICLLARCHGQCPYRRTRTPNLRGGGTEADLYQQGFDATWELDVFGGVRRSVEAADGRRSRPLWTAAM